MVVTGLGFVAELDRPVDAAFGDRAGVTVMQAHDPVRTGGHSSGEATACLVDDGLGRVYRVGELTDDAAEPGAAPPTAQATPSVREYAAGVTDGPAGEFGEPSRRSQDVVSRLVGAAPYERRDLP